MFESNSVLWGFNAIKYLDSIYQIEQFKSILNSQVWSELKTEWLKISKLNPRAIGFYNEIIASENRDLGFKESIAIIKKEDNNM
ncbi:hypothetical protein V6R21_07945 [Limibacter armeniacum]|uniref:hypothetical protein n=1 Tax=Limibacter armeniacum TaxID=466084 RepID=UPI002FE5C8EB